MSQMLPQPGGWLDPRVPYITILGQQPVQQQWQGPAPQPMQPLGAPQQIVAPAQAMPQPTPQQPQQAAPQAVQAPVQAPAQGGQQPQQPQQPQPSSIDGGISAANQTPVAPPGSVGQTASGVPVETLAASLGAPMMPQTPVAAPAPVDTQQLAEAELVRMNEAQMAAQATAPQTPGTYSFTDWMTGNVAPGDADRWQKMMAIGAMGNRVGAAIAGPDSWVGRGAAAAGDVFAGNVMSKNNEQLAATEDQALNQFLSAVNGQPQNDAPQSTLSETTGRTTQVGTAAGTAGGTVAPKPTTQDVLNMSFGDILTRLRA